MVLENNENHWFFDFVWGRDSLPPARAAAVPPGIAKYTFKVCTILKKLPEASSQTQAGTSEDGCRLFQARVQGEPPPFTTDKRIILLYRYSFPVIKLEDFL